MNATVVSANLSISSLANETQNAQLCGQFKLCGHTHATTKLNKQFVITISFAKYQASWSTEKWSKPKCTG